MGIQPLHPSPRMILYLSILVPFLFNSFKYIPVSFEYIIERRDGHPIDGFTIMAYPLPVHYKSCAKPLGSDKPESYLHPPIPDISFAVQTL